MHPCKDKEHEDAKLWLEDVAKTQPEILDLIRVDKVVIVNSKIKLASEAVRKACKKWQEDWDNGIQYPFVPPVETNDNNEESNG